MTFSIPQLELFISQDEFNPDQYSAKRKLYINIRVEDPPGQLYRKIRLSIPKVFADLSSAILTRSGPDLQRCQISGWEAVVSFLHFSRFERVLWQGVL